MGVRERVAAARASARRRANRRAVARFGEFWQALQEVGDALSEAQKAAKNAESGDWRARNQRHWTIAGVDEVRTALLPSLVRASKSSGTHATKVRRSVRPSGGPFVVSKLIDDG